MTALLLSRPMRAAVAVGTLLNQVVSFVVFSFLDVLDVVLCLAYKLADYAVEAEWKPCYCSSTAKDMILTAGGAAAGGMSKVVCLCSHKLQLEDISDTLYVRPSLVSDVSRSTVRELRRLKTERRSQGGRARIVATTAATSFTISSSIVEMLQGRIGGQQPHPIPRWSDCGCKKCSTWTRPPAGLRDSLFVHAEGPRDGGAAKEDILFIHGFISTSAFWTETVFPNLSEASRSRYRLLAVDLLGFGKSPKPADSLYTLREHVEMIERSVLDRYKVKSFHIVAHSLGSILALALAVKYPTAIKSLTILAPPYFPVPKGEQGTQYVLRQVAPRRVWPPIAFGSSLACWYEHISRTICLLICKNHRIWEFAFKFLTRNRVKTFLMEGFFCHTHNAAWHTLHNIICGSASKIEGYLEVVQEQLSCDVTVFHGEYDDLLPVSCSYALKSRVPRARVVVVGGKDHITVIIGRERAFTRELEDIWSNAKC